MKEYLTDTFPNVNVVKIVDFASGVSIYFDGFDGEINSSIRKAIIRCLKTHLTKRFPKFYFHVAHVIHGLS